MGVAVGRKNKKQVKDMRGEQTITKVGNPTMTGSKTHKVGNMKIKQETTADIPKQRVMGESVEQ